ncbi:MAG: hypothetical protein H6742_21885 [Alphaproteobacteria bacterium]|nr:hypothetical protein [Alphaproteobacteria bacterium]
MLLLSLLMACPKAPTSSTPAPAVDAPVAAGVATAPATGAPALPSTDGVAGAPPTPPLSGSTDAIIVEGLSRTSLTFTVGADLGPVALIDPSEADILEAHLAAHPGWRVTRWDGATMAFLRTDSDHGRVVPWAGYHGSRDEKQIWRAAVRIRPRSAGAEWAESPLIDRFTPTDNMLKVHGWQPGGEGWYLWRAAAIEVVGPVATVEVHELSTRLELNQTSDALRWITTDLQSLDKFHDDVDTSQQPWGWLPPGEPTSDAQGVYVDAIDGGIEVTGRLNPGRPGWTWVRITDAYGRPWLEPLVGAATLERIGWSSNPAQSFWLQGRVPTDTPLPAGAIVEAWFQPTGGSAEQLGRWGIGG